MPPPRPASPAEPGAVLVGPTAEPPAPEFPGCRAVRRGKLGLYEAWGFPEVWVEVPDAESRSRSPRRPSGLTIHRLAAGGDRPAAAMEGILAGARADEQATAGPR